MKLKLPLKAQPVQDYPHNGHVVNIKDANGTPISQVVHFEKQMTVEIADAIVQACNEHEKLKHKLTLILNELNNIPNVSGEYKFVQAITNIKNIILVDIV